MHRALVAVALIILSCSAPAAEEPASPDTPLLEAQRAFDAGQRLNEAGQYSAALPLIQRALTLRKKVLQERHPKVIDCLDLLGTLHLSLSNHAQAEPPLVRALQLREAIAGKHHPHVAASLNNLAYLYYSQGLYTRAEPLFVRALKIWEATPGEHSLNIATVLNNQALLYQAQGLYTRAEPLYSQALKLLEVALGENHASVALSLNNLAALYSSQGLYGRAEPLYVRSLKIREATLGNHHPDIAQSLNNLAFLYDAQGFYARAEPLYTRALRIWEASLGEHHPHVATSLNNLATVYHSQGLYTRAEPLLERALSIREFALGEGHPEVATALNNLASLYHSQGLHTRAEPLYSRALKLQEAALGEHHPHVAQSLNNLAVIYSAQGFHELAEPLLERALKIHERALGAHHPETATSLNNLAALYDAQGLYARAEPLYARALKIWEASLGEHHPNVTQSLNNLALLHLARQNLDEALPLLERAFIASEQHLRKEVFGFSEKHLGSFLHSLRANEELLYALVRTYPSDPRVLQLALSAAFLRRGRSVQEVANTSLIIYRNLNPSDRDTFERLRALRTQLATVSLAGPGRSIPADYQQRLKALSDEGDALEADLARRSEPLRRLHALPPPAPLVSRITTVLPTHSALVEFVAYRDRLRVPAARISPAQQEEGPMRYLAFLLFDDGRTVAVDLGLAEPLDRAALRLHDALARQSSAYLPEAQSLYTLAFRPLEPYLGRAKRLFLTPDGQLNLVPFAALHDGRRFLVDAFDITYLTSGKDLLPRSAGLPSPRSVIVLADPDFGSLPSTPSSEGPAEPGSATRPASLARFFSTLRAEAADIPWTPLPGTRREADAIQRLFPHAQLLLGPSATKHSLLKLSAPGVLHIATHGFFLEDTSASSTSRAVGNFGAVGAGPLEHPADPLLRSGLVLAGLPPSFTLAGLPGAEDSLVTALELAGLNLWGTQLVVLSACDTGRGDVKLGEGVFGLRRAFLVAGAETLVTSLWKVNDETTHQLMERYYRHLLAGLGRTAALREAMRELRQQQPHPHFWAPFTALGLNAPLQGLAPRTAARPSP